MCYPMLSTIVFEFWKHFETVLTGGALLPPFSVGYVKGWKRATMALIVLQAVKELELADQVPHYVKVSCRLHVGFFFHGTMHLQERNCKHTCFNFMIWIKRFALCPVFTMFFILACLTGSHLPWCCEASLGTVFVSFSPFKDVRAQVHANRGLNNLQFDCGTKFCSVSCPKFCFGAGFLDGICPVCLAGVGLLSTATRLRPNAFHFRRQVIILQRAGGGNTDRQFDELWLTLCKINK